MRWSSHRARWAVFATGVSALAIVGSMTASPAIGTLARPSTAATMPCGSVSTPPTYKHVIVITDENRSYGQIIGSASAPYINSLASECGLASDYHNITHESLPNYLGLTSGLNYKFLLRFDNDCVPLRCSLERPSLFSEAPSWKEYDESMPVNCDLVDSHFYVARHNPAVYYRHLDQCATNDVPLGTTDHSPLLQDFSRESSAPSFSFVSGNLCDDMHGNPGCQRPEIKTGDAWLSTWIPLITSTHVYRSGNTAVLLLWDEGSKGRVAEHCEHQRVDQSCHVAAIVVAPSVTPGTVVDTPCTHYSSLRTIEDLLGIPELGEAQRASSMVAGFNL